ncbi:MAG TPA: hypothetical protein VGJ82_05515 [Thermoanaerobaculia bacterium]|jgi:hypothetical protein
MQELSLSLDDIQIEEIIPVELSEDTKGHPENLASSSFNCTSVSSSVMLE